MDSNLKLKIEGMTCGHCAQSVTGELKKIAGISEVEVNQPEGEAVIHANPAPSRDELDAAIAKAGYKLISVS